MFKAILAGLVIGIFIIATGGDNTPVASSSVSSSGYSDCKNDPTTRFQAGMYKDKYPSLSIDQILHTLCKDK